jgi:hypothetical protein
MNFSRDTALLLTTEDQLPERDPVWGTGGWLPPEQREALDWLTLLRFMGWEVAVTYPEEFCSVARAGQKLKWLVIAMPPDQLPSEVLVSVRRWLEREAILLIARAGTAADGLAASMGIKSTTEHARGQELHWNGTHPHRRWHCRNEVCLGTLQCEEIPDLNVTLDGQTLIAGRRTGPGMMVFLGFHPGQARDQDAVLTSVLRHVLLHGSPAPAAALRWHGMLALRMDDPGSAELVHHDTYADCRKLDSSAWSQLGQVLADHKARLTVGYVPGWVDDGNANASELRVQGLPVPRKAGMVHPSPLVIYRRQVADDSTVTYDYQAEHGALLGLREQGVVELAAHGFTHMDPRLQAWLHAPDAHTHPKWFREFSPDAMRFLQNLPESMQPLSRSLDWIQLHFGHRPQVVIFPGEVFTTESIAAALNLDLQLVSSYYLAIRHARHFCWVQHVCAPYLDRADPAWFDAGLPVVACFHDWDISRGGIDWLQRCLQQWTRAGATALIDLDEVVARLSLRLSLDVDQERPRLTVQGALPRNPIPVEVELHVPGKPFPTELEIVTEGFSRQVQLLPAEAGTGRTVLQLVPPSTTHSPWHESSLAHP